MAKRTSRARTNELSGSMTANEFAKLRNLLELTQMELGMLLGLSGDPVRSIGRYERGETPIPGPIIMLMRAYLDGYRPQGWPIRLLMKDRKSGT